MEQTKKIRLLQLLVVVLFLMNITTIATIIYKQVKDKKLTEDVNKTSRIGFSGGNHFFDYYLRFNSEQSQKLLKINELFNARMTEKGKHMRDIKILMSKQLAENKDDTTKMNKIFGEILAAHDSINKMNYTYYREIRSMCDQEQTRRLDIFFSKSININPSAAKNSQSN